LSPCPAGSGWFMGEAHPRHPVSLSPLTPVWGGGYSTASRGSWRVSPAPCALQALLKTGENSWSLAELVQALVLLTHYHSLASFVFGCGINPEEEQDGEHGCRPPSPHSDSSPASDDSLGGSVVRRGALPWGVGAWWGAGLHCGASPGSCPKVFGSSRCFGAAPSSQPRDKIPRSRWDKPGGKRSLRSSPGAVGVLGGGMWEALGGVWAAGRVSFSSPSALPW